MKRVHLLLILLCVACGEQTQEVTVATAEKATSPLFEFVESDESGIKFSNDIEDMDGINFFNYLNIFDGGGVAIGDINNDGLADIYFTGQMVSNKLYLNKGGLVFEDITRKASVAADIGWCSGVTMADVNGDGFLDIYVGRAFNDQNAELRENLLYINNGDLTFSEQAKAYGVNDAGYNSQSSFFDYDLDGDLDLYVGNHPRDDFFLETTQPEIRWKMLANPTLKESDKLYRNNGDGTFTDVTIEAGILNYAFILGLVTADLNQDGWPDIYAANDHQEPDFYYVNNGDGTFTDQAHQKLKHISNFAMGIDFGDFNNDGLVDYTVVDMMAQDNYRQKTQMKAMSVEQFIYLVENGFHTQYMRNTLQLNNGNGTFSEIGQLAGMDKTDWSWAVLMTDFDNDGYKDIFISNGYRKDYRDRDFMDWWGLKIDSALQGLIDIDVQAIADQAGSTKLVNYYFTNNRDLTFTSEGALNGISQPTFSYGAAYGDLDNDGDLDLVVSNLDDKAYLYRNTADQTRGQNYLRIKLEGEGWNRFGYGAKVSLEHEGLIQYQELTATRGYQSSVEPIVHFGLKDWTHATVKVEWLGGKSQVLEGVEANQLLTLRQSEANHEAVQEEVEAPKLFTASTETGLDFTHVENTFDDFAKEILLPHKMSRFGPSLATGDVNGDGAEDLFVGGAKWQSGALYLQQPNGSFSLANVPALELDRGYEDLGSLFFDADNDKDLDLYIVSGGSEVPTGSPLLQDRLYLNNGKGQFSRAQDALPSITHSGSCVVAGDYDSDGDLDLFVGGRVIPGRYPFPVKSYILRNEGGRFSDVTEQVAPDLMELGMVSSAVWSDANGDGQIDLVLVGEWLPLTILQQRKGTFKIQSANYEDTYGWWNKIIASDFDKDGDIDYVAGNYGLNSKFRVSKEEPLHVYCHDFDRSGSMDIVLGYYNEGVCFPVRGMQCSSEQMPALKKKFLSYHEFGSASLNDVYGEDLDAALHYHVNTFASTYIENTPKGLKFHPLPTEAQFSTVFGICPEDFDQDGNLDILISGNFYVPEIETGQNDASIGLLLKGDGKGNFTPVLGRESGFIADRDVRDMVLLKRVDGSTLVVVANNNSRLQVFEWKRQQGLAFD